MRFIIFLIVLIPLTLSGQQYGFRTYSLPEGLPQSEVLDLLQDSRGSIWIATDGGGLSRFNGNTFETYTIEDGLPNNQINALYEDSKGNLWIGARDGFTKYNGIEFITYTEENAPPIRTYQEFFEDEQGNIGIVSRNEQNLTRLLKIIDNEIIDIGKNFSDLTNGNQIIQVVFLENRIVYIITDNGLYELRGNDLRYSPLNDYKELQKRIIIPGFFDDDNTLWLRAVANPNDIHIYTYKNGILEPFQSPDGIWWHGVTHIFKDSKNRLWFGNYGEGIAIYDETKESLTYFRQSNSLPSDFIVAFLEDHEGNIWLGSQGGGLIKYSRNSFVAYNFDQIINGDIVRTIYQDRHGNYWFGLAGTGIVKYDRNTFTPYSKNDYPGINNVRDIIELNDREMLIISINGLFLFDGIKLRTANHLFGLDNNLAFLNGIMDGDTIWLATTATGVIKIVDRTPEFFTVQNGMLNSNNIRSIMKDSQGKIWFSTNNGVAVYYRGKVTSYTTREGLNSSVFMQAAEDQHGRYWFASYHGGLNIFDGENFTYLTKKDGLASNNIYSILTDHEGNIWAGTQNGVDKILLDTAGNISGISNFGIYEGFTGIENNGAANYADRQNNLWFGTVNGAMKYDPGGVEPNKIPPIILLTEIRLFYREIDWRNNSYEKCLTDVTPWFALPQNLTLPYDSNHISFEFEALSYQVPEKVSYQWKLEGLDKFWTPVTKKTEAVYPNIPPGMYTFKVRAMNNDGVWNTEPAEFSFEITALWWRTWWFFTLLGIFVFSIIVLIFRFRIKIIEVKKKELERIVNGKTAEVVSQRDEIVRQNKQLEQQTEEILSQTEKLQTAYTNLENLSEIGKIITSQLSVENIIDTAYESINKLMDATVFGIGIINEDKKTIDFPGVKEKGETLGHLSFSLDDELRLSSYCIKTKKEIFINDFEKEYKKYLPAITPAGKSGNSSSIIYLPLLRENRILGVITVQSFDKNAYSEYHLNILRNLAVYAKIALENAFAYKKIEEQTENLKKANENILNQKVQIEQANKDLIELNNEKNHLIGIVAHDLRNPLTSTLSVADNLKENAKYLKKDDKTSIDFMQNALRRMNMMISKILDIRMIEKKGINLNCEKVNLGQVVHEVFQNMKETADKKGIKIKLEKKSLYGVLDRNYLTQIFENLLSNAIKFSPPDKIVWIKVKEQNGDVRVAFIDEGPGIPPDEIPYLFKKFKKLSTRPTAGEQSTGLGLSIVKKYVDVMGGNIWCESKPGKGSTFTVSFQKY